MPVPSLTPYAGQLPVEGDPATFSPRASALLSWLVTVAAPELTALVNALNVALDGNATAMDALDLLNDVPGLQSHLGLGAAAYVGTSANANFDQDVIKLPNRGTVKTFVDSKIKRFESVPFLMANSTNYTIPHGLGGLPDVLTVRLHCEIADLGFAVGDVISIAPNADTYSSDEGLGVWMTSSDIVVRVDANGPGEYVNKTGISGQLTANKWKLGVVAVRFP